MMKWLSLTFLSVVILVGYANAQITTWTGSVPLKLNIKYEKEGNPPDITIASSTDSITAAISLYTASPTDITLVQHNDCYIRLVDIISGTSVCFEDVFYIKSDVTNATSDQILLIGFDGGFSSTIPYTFSTGGRGSPPVVVPIDVRGKAYMDVQGKINYVNGNPASINISSGKIGGGAVGLDLSGSPGLPKNDRGYGIFALTFSGTLGGRTSSITLLPQP
jgi:hypothetical protein